MPKCVVKPLDVDQNGIHLQVETDLEMFDRTEKFTFDFYLNRKDVITESTDKSSSFISQVEEQVKARYEEFKRNYDLARTVPAEVSW